MAATLLVLAVPGVAAAADDPTALVNPFIGTENFGNTFPGASLPFGMVQVSPDNGGQGVAGRRRSAAACWGYARQGARRCALTFSDR